MTQIHLAVVYDEFCKGIHERVRTTGWEVGIAHSERLGVYNCIIRKKDSKIPSKEDRAAGRYPENYYYLESRDFRSMQIGIDQVLTKHNL
jgi:hypothetical protein